MTPSGWRQEKLPLCQKSISWNDKLIHHTYYEPIAKLIICSHFLSLKFQSLIISFHFLPLIFREREKETLM